MLSGCGGTGSTASGTGASAAAAKAQFVAQAARICAGVSTQEQPLKRREESLKHVPLAQADQEFVSLAREAASIARAADGELAKLPRPSGDAHTIEGLLRAYSEEATDATRIADAAANQENSAGEVASRALASSILHNSSSAKSYGMKDCFVLE